MRHQSSRALSQQKQTSASTITPAKQASAAPGGHGWPRSQRISVGMLTPIPIAMELPSERGSHLLFFGVRRRCWNISPFPL